MDCIDVLKNLIRFNTTNPPGNEHAAVKYLAEILRPYGFLCEIQNLGQNRANLVAVLENGEGPELILNGHLDVVPAVGDWKHTPFDLTAEGDRLYGRGTADMKGGIAAMCEAAIRIAKRGGPKSGKITLLFVADEECANLGTLNYLQKYEAGGYAIIGEPTGLDIGIAHRGVSRDYVDIRGDARHAALPSQKYDSIAKTACAIQAFQAMNDELQAITHEILPSPSIAITKILGYEKDNIVPGSVRLLLDVRVLPEMSHNQVVAILMEVLEQADIEDYSIKKHFYMPGGALSSQDEFVKLCLRERNILLGEAKFPVAFHASCEQCFFIERGISAIICGPGDISQAHTVDEFTSESQVRLAVDLYERIIEKVLERQ